MEWHAIPGFPDYEVSDNGLVRVVALRGTPMSQAKLLLPTVSDGYNRVTLLRPKRRPVFAHVLVLEAFVGPCPPGQETRHIDGNRTNNRLTNLAWGSDPENAADRDGHGTTARGTMIGLAKLTDDQVRDIRRRYAQGGHTHRSLAAEYGTAHTQIGAILRRQTWRHLT